MIAALDDLLRAQGVFRVGRGRVPVARLTLWLVVCGFGYGLAMGSFPGRIEQALYSGSKVPLLLTVSTVICLPNFFVVNAMLGLRDDFSAALRAVVTAQATVAVTRRVPRTWPASEAASDSASAMSAAMRAQHS